MFAQKIQLFFFITGSTPKMKPIAFFSISVQFGKSIHASFFLSLFFFARFWLIKSVNLIYVTLTLTKKIPSSFFLSLCYFMASVA